MDKKSIQRHKGRLSIIAYKRNGNLVNTVSGEITALTREHTIISINKEDPEIFIKNENIVAITSIKREMEKFKDEDFTSISI